MTYCNTCNILVINIAWYIEYTMNEVKHVVEDCLNLPPTIEKKNYTFVNGNKEESQFLDEEDWEDGWSQV
jgi:hypothetical protein